MSWQSDAGCKDHPEPELWHPPAATAKKTEKTSEKIQRAVEVCRSCVVRIECLREHYDETYGIWGGYTTQQRNLLNRQGLVSRHHVSPGV